MQTYLFEIESTFRELTPEIYISLIYNNKLILFHKSLEHVVEYDFGKREWKVIPCNIPRKKFRMSGVVYGKYFWSFVGNSVDQIDLDSYECVSTYTHFFNIGYCGSNATQVEYKDSLIAFGNGLLSNQFIRFHFNSKKFEIVRPKTEVFIMDDIHSHSAVVYKDKMFVWGGYPANNDLWSFHLIDYKWKKINQTGSIPSQRWGQSLIVHGDKLYLFGGFAFGFMNDFYEYDIETCHWTKLETEKTPVKRYFHSCHKYKNHLYITAGYGCTDTGKYLHKVKLPNIEKPFQPMDYYVSLFQNNALVDIKIEI